jgi:hypothetical protein
MASNGLASCEVNSWTVRPSKGEVRRYCTLTRARKLFGAPDRLVVSELVQACQPTGWTDTLAWVFAASTAVKLVEACKYAH